MKQEPCIHCGKLFWKHDARKVYCNKLCKAAYNRQEQKARRKK